MVDRTDSGFSDTFLTPAKYPTDGVVQVVFAPWKCYYSAHPPMAGRSGVLPGVVAVLLSAGVLPYGQASILPFSRMNKTLLSFTLILPVAATQAPTVRLG
jgi:hypothetical protein